MNQTRVKLYLIFLSFFLGFFHLNTLKFLFLKEILFLTFFLNSVLKKVKWFKLFLKHCLKKKLKSFSEKKKLKSFSKKIVLSKKHTLLKKLTQQLFQYI